MGGSGQARAPVHFGALVVALGWSEEWCDLELLGEARDALEGLVFPGEWNAALPECDDQLVDEGLLVEGGRVA